MQFTTYTRLSPDLAHFYNRITNVRDVSIHVTDGNCSELLRISISTLPRKRLKDVSLLQMNLRAT